MGNLREPLSCSLAELETLGAATVGRYLGMNADPSMQNEAAGRASMSHAARPWAGPLLTRPNPSSCGCGHGCAEKREASGVKLWPKPKRTNAHECLRMLFLSSSPPPSLLSHPPPPSSQPPPPPMPACLRPRQPCHGETGGAQIYVTPPTHSHLPSHYMLCHCKMLSKVLCFFFFWPPVES